MFSLIVENEKQARLELTNNPAFDIVSTDGFDPPDAVINTTRGAGEDGSVFNSAHLENRVITLTIAINNPAEENRVALYDFFKPKRRVRLYHKTQLRDVYCDGYVQNFPVDYFAKKEVAQITIVCPEPYLIGTADSVTEFSYVEPLFEFPFAIEAEGEAFSELHTVQEEIVKNGGDMSAGAIIEIHATGTLVNPSILNADTGEIIDLTYTLAATDSVFINTKAKQQAIYLLRGGVKTNLVGYISSRSRFLEFAPGDTALVLDATTGASNAVVTVTVEDHFAGV